MTPLFLAILGMSLAASAAILAVLAARLPLRRAPKAFSYALWAIVLLRLISPVSVRSPLSVMNLLPHETTLAAVSTPLPQSGTHTGTGGALSYDAAEAAPGVSATSEASEPSESDTRTPTERTPAAGTPAAPAARPEPRDILLCAASWIWLAGAAAMGARGVVRYVVLRRRLVGAVKEQEGVFLADGADVPFTLGVFRPRIYIPSDLDERERGYILAHERCHVRRGDNLTRVLAYAALCIHWFNPLVWAAFILSGRDMELSCDEAVLRRAPSDIRAEYAASILRYSCGTGRVAASPLSFGEGEPKSRIKNVMNFRKPAVWAVVIAGTVCALTTAAFATDAVHGEKDKPAAKFTHEDYEAYLKSAETYYPNWAEPGTEIVCNGEGNYTVTLGALLSEEDCRERWDEIGGSFLPEGADMLVRPGTKAVYDRDGFLQNVYYEYPEGSGEYVSSPPEAGLADYNTALDNWRTHYPQFASPNSELYYGEGGEFAGSGDMLSEEEFYARYGADGAAALSAAAAHPFTTAVYDEAGGLSEVRICLPGTDGLPSSVTTDEVPTVRAPDGSDISVRFAQLWCGVNSGLVYGRTDAADTDGEVSFLLESGGEPAAHDGNGAGDADPVPCVPREEIYDILPYYFTEHGAEQALANGVFLWRDGVPYRELRTAAGNVGMAVRTEMIDASSDSIRLLVGYFVETPEGSDDVERGAVVTLGLVEGEWYIDDYEYVDVLSDGGRRFEELRESLLCPRTAEPNTVIVYDEMCRPTVISGGLSVPDGASDGYERYIESSSIVFYDGEGRLLPYTARLVPGSRDAYVLTNPNVASMWLPYRVTAEDGTDLTFRVGNLWAAAAATGKQVYHIYAVRAGEDGRTVHRDVSAENGLRRVPGTGELVSRAEAENYPGAYPCYATLEELGGDIRNPLELWTVRELAGEYTPEEPALLLRDGILYFPIDVPNEYGETGGRITGAEVRDSSPERMTLEISYCQPDGSGKGSAEMTIVRGEDGVWEME